MKEKYHQERLDKGIELLPDSLQHKKDIGKSLTAETKTSMQDERSKVAGVKGFLLRFIAFLNLKKVKTY